MLSKEKIEDIKDSLRLLHKILWNEHREGTYTIQRTLEYINQLETNNKNLIEKLEEDKFKIESTYSQINGNYFMAQDRLDLINEILKIAKGEKE